MVFRATLSTVLSRTTTSRLTTSTPRMYQRRRRTDSGFNGLPWQLTWTNYRYGHVSQPRGGPGYSYDTTPIRIVTRIVIKGIRRATDRAARVGSSISSGDATAAPRDWRFTCLFLLLFPLPALRPARPLCTAARPGAGSRYGTSPRPRSAANAGRCSPPTT